MSDLLETFLTVKKRVVFLLRDLLSIDCLGEKWCLWMLFIRSEDRFASQDGHRMVVTGAPFSQKQIIVCSDSIDMGTLCDS